MSDEKITVTPMRAQRVRRNFSLYALYDLSGGACDEKFTISLPFAVAEFVGIEDVSTLLRPDTFDLFRERMGTDSIGQLQAVRYALVHRYEPMAFSDHEGNWVREEMIDDRSSELVRSMSSIDSTHATVRPADTGLCSR
jgi:hypothetical protein